MLEQYFVKPSDHRPDPGVVDRPGDRAIRRLAGRATAIGAKSVLAPCPGAGRLRRVRPRARCETRGRPAGSCRRLRGRAGRRAQPACAPDASEPDGQGGPWPDRADALGRAPRLRADGPAPSCRCPSPTPLPASSTTWSKSVACAPPRRVTTATTSTASRPISTGSGVSSTSSRRRSSAPTSPSAPARASPRRPCASGCGVLRVFLRYAHREGVLGRDLSGTVGVAPGLPARHHPPLDLLGGRRPSARRRRPPHPVREARLRDLAPCSSSMACAAVRSRRSRSTTSTGSASASPSPSARPGTRPPSRCRLRRRGDPRLPPARPARHR